MPKTTKRKQAQPQRRAVRQDASVRAQQLAPPMPRGYKKDKGQLHKALEKLTHVDGVCSESVRRWSKLVSDPFNAPYEGVYMPLAEDNFPCASVKMRNYGSEEITVSVGNTCVGLWLYPDGIQSPDSSESRVMSSITFAGPITTYLGPVQNSVWGLASALGCYQQTPSGISDNSPGFASSVPLLYDFMEHPGHAGDVSTSPVSFQKIRTTACGIRVSFVGKLTDTEGYIEFYNPYEASNIPGNTTELTALRRDASFRRKFFSAQRTHTFVWHPNCEAIKYSDVAGNTWASPTTSQSRMILNICGLESGDKLLIEYITSQEMTDQTYASILTPAFVTPDAIHVQNALSTVSGKLNKHDDGGRPLTIMHGVAASKLQHHPMASDLGALKNMGSAIASTASSGVAAAVKNGLKNLSSLAREAGTGALQAAIVGPLMA